jgi:hypothetical protein
MSAWRRVSISLGLVLVVVGLAACGSSPAYEEEGFNPKTPYQYPISVQVDAACEAAKLALLSQGYVIALAGTNELKASKDFQPGDDSHAVIEFNVTCASTRSGTMLYVNALEKTYKLKKNNNSAGLSVPTLGSISLPWSSSTDSLVMVASKTISDTDFYKRFYGLVDKQLGINQKH